MTDLELERHLDYPELGRTHEYFQEHLEPRRPELDASDRLVLYEEEAGHRVTRLAGLLEDDPGQVLAPHGDGPPHHARQTSVSAAPGVAARHHHVGIRAACDLQHLANLLGRVLQIGVHYAGVLARAGEQLHTRRYRRREAAVPLRPFPAHQVNAVVLFGEALDHLRRTVR